jgi:hypothetical protein
VHRRIGLLIACVEKRQIRGRRLQSNTHRVVAHPGVAAIFRATIGIIA